MRVPQWFVLVWVLVIAVVAVGGAIFSYTFVRDRSAELDRVLDLPELPQIGSAAEAPQPVTVPTEAASAPGEPAATQDASSGEGEGEDAGDTIDAAAEATAEADEIAALGGEAAVWDDPRRVTILLLGVDQRQGETGPFPTDTMILFSLDPVGKTAAILSIPRDLWVEYPELGQPGRINTANILGDEINYPGGGGPVLAARTVERTLAVKVDYYVVINFEVFNTVIDAVGPIEVCPPEPIDDDRYPDGSYGYITIHFDAGCQELDAERLLQYARTRHGDSDIGRSSRQQEVILAVRDRVLSTGGVTALLPEIPALWESMQANVRTNLELEEMIRLARTAESIPGENIRQGQITFEDVWAQTTPEGDNILIPIATDIRLLIEDLFRPAGAPSAREPVSEPATQP
ncbi:MAG: LCP family protein [Chloroflexi bacterium]|nr:LCP family protein [Chloroflexota bacterium]